MRRKAVLVMTLAVVVIAGAAMDSTLALHLLVSALFVVAVRCSICNCLGPAGRSEVNQPVDQG